MLSLGRPIRMSVVRMCGIAGFSGCGYARQELLLVDELGFVPLSKTGAEMLFEIFSQRYERSSTPVTSNRVAGRRYPRSEAP
jgi:hypothetical protein